MNNQRKAIYIERRRVLEGSQLKKQVIGYGVKTMNEIVDAYLNPELPPEEWDLSLMLSKVKEFIYLLENLTADQIEGLNSDQLKAFLAEQMRNAYDLKEAQIENQRPGLMEKRKGSLSFSKSTHYGETRNQWMLCVNQLDYVATDKKTLLLNIRMRAMICF